MTFAPFTRCYTVRIGWPRVAVLGANDGIVSTASRVVGVALPLAAVLLVPQWALIAGVSLTSLLLLERLGAVVARVGGARPLLGAWPVASWGALAMVITAGVGAWFGTVA